MCNISLDEPKTPMLQWHSPGGIRGKKISFTTKQNTVTAVFQVLKKSWNTADFLFVLISLQVASTGKNSIAYPAGKQLLFKQIPVLGWHRSTALWFFSVHPINPILWIAGWVRFLSSQHPDNQCPALHFGIRCYKAVLPSN